MSTVDFKRDDDLGVITFNDQPLNLLSEKLLTSLSAIINGLESEDIRALLFTADEGNFSAGADISMFKDMKRGEASAMLEKFFQFIYRIEGLPYPTMAAVSGLCIGGGFELALSCDFIWAADNAQFAAAEALVGIVPLGGGARMLAQRAGIARAKEVVFSGRFFKPGQLESWNIINRVLPLPDLNDKAVKYMKSLSNGPTMAHGATKKILKAFSDNGRLESDKVLMDVVPPLFESEDLKTGIESLLKEGPGKARFSGR